MNSQKLLKSGRTVLGSCSSLPKFDCRLKIAVSKKMQTTASKLEKLPYRKAGSFLKELGKFF